jgi:hypothetical protein
MQEFKEVRTSLNGLITYALAALGRGIKQVVAGSKSPLNLRRVTD